MSSRWYHMEPASGFFENTFLKILECFQENPSVLPTFSKVVSLQVAILLKLDFTTNILAGGFQKRFMVKLNFRM